MRTRRGNVQPSPRKQSSLPAEAASNTNNTTSNNNNNNNKAAARKPKAPRADASVRSGSRRTTRSNASTNNTKTNSTKTNNRATRPSNTNNNNNNNNKSSPQDHPTRNNNNNNSRSHHTQDSTTQDDERSLHSAPPPLPVIHTTPQKIPYRGTRNPNALDDTTLGLFSHVLTNKKQRGDPLDDDAVTDHMIRMNRIAHTTASYQQQLLAGHTSSRDNNDSDNDSVESLCSSVFGECLQEEVEHHVGANLFRETMADIRKLQQQQQQGETVINNNKRTSIASSTTSNNNTNHTAPTIDKKTQLWLKRAAGLYRSDGGGLLFGSDPLNNNKGGSGRVSTRRYTRQQAQDGRKKKRERGLDVLTMALEDLEPLYGPFPVRKKPRTNKQKNSKRSNNNKSNSHGQKDPPNQVIARKQEQTRLLEEKAAKAKKSAKTKRAADLRRSRRVPIVPVKRQQDVCVDLKDLDWLWRYATRQYDLSKQTETAQQYYDLCEVPLHPGFQVATVTHDLPSMQSLVRTRDHPHGMPGRVFDPPRVRHTDHEYALYCHSLANGLSGQGRTFCTYEFFYSDLDRAWYNDNPFAHEAARLGVPVDAKLTKREWKAVRRAIQKRPRRFSAKFIAQQLGARNQYRCHVRWLQKHPHLANKSLRFGYPVYAPIRCGTTVHALSKRHPGVHRGRVLTYDRNTAVYLIEFENVHLEHELCPDSEVATAGIPDLLIPCSHPFAVFQHASSYDPTAMPLGSGTGPQAGMEHSASSPATERGAALRKPLIHGTIPGERETALLQKVANRDALLTLLETIEIAQRRRQALVSLLSDALSLKVSHLPFGDWEADDTVSSVVRGHVEWIEVNLRLTNNTLSTAMEELRMLYGNVFFPGRYDTSTPNNKSRDNQQSRSDRLMESKLREQVESIRQSPFAQSWNAKLFEDAESVGHAITSKFFKSADYIASSNQSKAPVYLGDRVSAASQLLAMASFATGEIKASGSSACGPALSRSLEKLCCVSLLPAATMISNAAPQLHTEAHDARAAAVSDLQRALTQLQTEIAAANGSNCKKKVTP